MNKLFGNVIRIKYSYTCATFHFKYPKAFFANKPLTMRDKMKMIREKEEKFLKENHVEISQKEIKIMPAMLQLQKIRGIIYLSIPFLIWTNPFTLLYSKLILSSNYYMIFLTTLEAAAFFSLGLNAHNLNIIANLNSSLKSQVTRKRLMLMVIFFTFLLISAILSSKFKNSQSLGLLTILNLYLFIKISYHITLYNLDKLIFNQKLKNLSMNMVICCLMLLINFKKTKEINNNILY